jgi:hypothetical protein
MDVAQQSAQPGIDKNQLLPGNDQEAENLEVYIASSAGLLPVQEGEKRDFARADVFRVALRIHRSRLACYGLASVCQLFAEVFMEPGIGQTWFHGLLGSTNLI